MWHFAVKTSPRRLAVRRLVNGHLNMSCSQTLYRDMPH
jgi:hypothetical protein